MASVAKEIKPYVPAARVNAEYTSLSERESLLQEKDTMRMFQTAANSPTGWHTVLQAAPMMPSRSLEADHASTVLLKPCQRNQTKRIKMSFRKIVRVTVMYQLNLNLATNNGSYINECTAMNINDKCMQTYIFLHVTKLNTGYRDVGIREWY